MTWGMLCLGWEEGRQSYAANFHDTLYDTAHKILWLIAVSLFSLQSIDSYEDPIPCRVHRSVKLDGLMVSLMGIWHRIYVPRREMFYAFCF